MWTDRNPVCIALGLTVVDLTWLLRQVGNCRFTKGSYLAPSCKALLRRNKKGLFPLSHTGLKAFRQQLRKSARAKGFLGLNKIKGFARQVCQSSSARAARNGMSPFQHSQQNTCMYSSGGSSRESRSLLEEVLQQQRWASIWQQGPVQLWHWHVTCLCCFHNYAAGDTVVELVLQSSLFFAVCSFQEMRLLSSSWRKWLRARAERFFSWFLLCDSKWAILTSL